MYENPLSSLRELMKQNSIGVYVLFHNDAHNSEYIAECDERVKFLSGFSGSNGLCVVTQNEALMWTDGRYYLQADAELSDGWSMKKMEKGQIKWYDWVKQNVKGIDIGWDFGQECGSLGCRSILESGLKVKDVGNLID
jgi:Xaa-Pro aminopeptidase